MLVLINSRYFPSFPGYVRGTAVLMSCRRLLQRILQRKISYHNPGVTRGHYEPLGFRGGRRLLEIYVNNIDELKPDEGW